MLGVAANHWFGSWSRKRSIGGSAEEIARTLKSVDWRRLSPGSETKGPRWHDWAYRELADLDAGQCRTLPAGAANTR